MANINCLPARMGDDVELLAAIAGGSEAALVRFYRLYHARIYSFIVKRLRSDTDAAEVLNEVMLEVWRNASAFQGRSQALTWVLGIAHHKTVDCLRRRPHHVELEDGAEENIEDETEGPVQLLARKQDEALLRYCLDKLSDAHRSVVHLAFFQELNYTEIATILGCPEGTVKTRMFHAKQKLKECLLQAGNV